MSKGARKGRVSERLTSLSVLECPAPFPSKQDFDTNPSPAQNLRSKEKQIEIMMITR
jgi:hypothetical protein